MTKWFLFISKAHHQHHSNRNLCPNHWCWRSWTWTFYEDLQELIELTPKKDALFIIGNWKAKVGCQGIAGVRGKFGLEVQNEASQRLTVLPREHTVHSKHLLPTTQEKTLHMDITRCSAPKSDWLYFLQPKMEKLYTVNKNKTRSWLWLRLWTPYCQIQT